MWFLLFIVIRLYLDTTIFYLNFVTFDSTLMYNCNEVYLMPHSETGQMLSITDKSILKLMKKGAKLNYGLK